MLFDFEYDVTDSCHQTPNCPGPYYDKVLHISYGKVSDRRLTKKLLWTTQVIFDWVSYGIHGGLIFT